MAIQFGQQVMGVDKIGSAAAPCALSPLVTTTYGNEISFVFFRIFTGLGLTNVPIIYIMGDS
jgi:hypothetical protein